VLQGHYGRIAVEGHGRGVLQHWGECNDSIGEVRRKWQTENEPTPLFKYSNDYSARRASTGSTVAARRDGR
jgi:hypothetical protein